MPYLIHANPLLNRLDEAVAVAWSQFDCARDNFITEVRTASCADSGVVSNGHPRNYCRPGGSPHTVTNADRTAVVFEGRTALVVAAGAEQNVLRDTRV